MKEKYFRIVELSNFQILLTKDFDNEEEFPIPILTLSFFIKGFRVDFSLKFSLEDKRDELFEALTNEEVEKIIRKTISQYIEDSEEE